MQESTALDKESESTVTAKETNSEKCQKDADLRLRFEEAMCKKLSNVNKKVSFSMTEENGIEKRAINRKQIDYLIDILSNKKIEAKNYYNYEKAYVVKKTGETKELHAKNKDKTTGMKMIALEDMWDRLWEVHRDVGFTGRVGMVKQAQKFYDNM